MKKILRDVGILTQIAVLFLVSIVISSVIGYFSQRSRTSNNVMEQIEVFADQRSNEVILAVKEFPAYEWLINYWYENYDQLEIEYDIDFNQADSLTQKKAILFNQHQPNLQLRYLTTDQVLALPEEDQKLYAEIAYSWLITRVNEIKRTYAIDYLFCVLTDPPYDKQFFLFSAADEGSKRGTEYEEVYTIGVTAEVNPSQQESMYSAVLKAGSLAEAGNYYDYYDYLGTINGHEVLIGTTFNLSNIMESITSRTSRDTIFMVVHEGWLALLCLLLLGLFFIKPLKVVQQNIRFYKETKNSAIVSKNLEDLNAENEIGQLSDDFVSLTKEMDAYLQKIETITAEKNRIETELTLAARIQSDMLKTDFPPFPEHHEFDVFAVMDPAREVGGDFYDFILIDEDHLCLVMADVSGKGIPAALFMMASKNEIANNAMKGASPAKILENTNEAICANNQEEMFVTVWLGILELSTGKLVAANAGHEYPMFKKPNGEYELYKDNHGFVIGGMEGMKYKEYTLQLEPGSKIFLYTDGLPEAADLNNTMFGNDRIVETLNENPDLSPEETLRNMQKAVDNFVKEAEQFDDLTMMSFTYYGDKEHMS